MDREVENEFRGWAVSRRVGLRRTAFLLCGDWFLADDLVQEALIRIYNVWVRLERSEDAGAYARRVLINLYLDHRRRPWRRERPTDQLPDLAMSPPDSIDDRDRLLAALRRVPGCNSRVSGNPCSNNFFFTNVDVALVGFTSYGIDY